MNDTVQKLMELADDYALWSSESQAGDARKRLQDELTRLFTPLDPAIVGLAIHDAEHGITAGESK